MQNRFFDPFADVRPIFYATDRERELEEIVTRQAEQLQVKDEQIADLHDNVEYLKGKLAILTLVQTTVTQRRVMALKQKVSSMPRRNMKIKSIDGKRYMDTAEIVTFFKEECEADIRFPQDIKNPWKGVKEYIDTICSTWGDEFAKRDVVLANGKLSTAYIICRD